MKKSTSIIIILFSVFSFILFESCADDDFDGGDGIDVTIPNFNFPTTVTFEQNLSAYNIFQGSPQDLVPSNDFHLLELSSILFTDYAKKQRLVKVPEGTQMTRLGDGTIAFPDSTILAKTFYYYNDERDTSLGKRIIETRLLIKNEGLWNVATYLWNDVQTDAVLESNGFDTQVDWITANGVSRSTLYHVPDENECIACHQSNSSTIPLGTSLRNLNREVIRNNASINQINHLQPVGVLNDFNINQVSQIIDYNDANATLAERARAYLDLNCSHCHNPDGWEESAEQDLDFRYETPFNQTGILQESDEIEEMIGDGEMPFIGTTVLDQEGVNLIVEFIENL